MILAAKTRGARYAVRHFLPCLVLIAAAAVVVVAGVAAAELLTLVVVLACPLKMVAMMRWGPGRRTRRPR